VNAFNLYAIVHSFWEPDSVPLYVLGWNFGPTVVWGWVLVAGASALIVTRYLQRRDDQAFLQAAMLVSFAFFILATRMHERYSFGAFLLAMPLVAFGRRYIWPVLILTITLFSNLVYSLAYQTVMENKTPGVDPMNLWPVGSHLLSVVNVGLFFALGAIYLGTNERALAARDAVETGMIATWLRVRGWFDPREGVAAMTPRDWWIAGAMTLGSFVICIMWYQYPAEKYFDEVYYPRAGEEYLEHKEIFEYTHPPLTKLIITLSMMLFGGLHGLGDTGFGWRFLNIVIGALTVGVLYIFAKHLVRSTLFASLAAGMLLFDGFHFVQSRIATPEITVAFFSLTTLYAFYRYWIAAQVRVRPQTTSGYRIAFAGVMVAGALVAVGVAWVAVHLGATTHPEYLPISFAISFLFVLSIPYVFARTALVRRFQTGVEDVSYPDGSRMTIAGKTVSGEMLDGTAVATKPVRSDGGVTRTFGKDGSLTYATPEGSATYAPDGSFTVAGLRIDPNDARTWLIVLTISSGLLAASKWNGLFDIIIVWLLAAFVFAQRWLRKPSLYGNPFGFPVDVLVASIFVVGGAIYTACYIPFFTLGHNLVDMVALQHDMYWYHSTLVATHPYASKWWQWPIIGKPISYYYTDFRHGLATQDPNACCVAEILALPNPFVWWLGLISVPVVGVLAWTERNKGYTLMIVAYFLQWLPWILSPRIAFEYHFYPNLSIIVLSNAIMIQKIWQWCAANGKAIEARNGIIAYSIIVVAAFIFFYPLLAGTHITWNQWHARIWSPSWII
jgi:predicted membrane-bound dolichyl-phosphate-mannose-protein mannosyltransferase